MEIGTWILVLIIYTSRGEPAGITAIPNFPDGKLCNDAGQIWVQRGKRRGYDCIYGPDATLNGYTEGTLK